jgi:pimeloyl-ACP methyl ester carboxylesterase
MNGAVICDGQFADLGNGTRLHFASSGTKGAPLMLFVHGFPQAWFEWEGQLGEFGRDHFAVAPDLRGFNLSSKPKAVEAYRAVHIVDDLARLIDVLGYDSAIVVAHDWGGAVAWNLAIFRPEKIKRLIIINAPHPYLFMRALLEDKEQQRSSEYMNWLRADGSELALARDRFRALEKFLADENGIAPAWYDEATQARYHAMWSTPGDAGSHSLTGAVNFYRASPLFPGAKSPAPALLDAAAWQVKVPTRVIWGENDRALLPRLLDGLDKVVPDLKITRVPGASHWIVQEDSERINQLIRSALES